MNLESDKRLNIQLRLDFSSAPTGEARQAGGEDIESLSVVSEPERPANTFNRVSATSRTAVYGPRTHGGVGGAELRGSPLSRSVAHQRSARRLIEVSSQRYSGPDLLTLSFSQFDPKRS